MAAEFSYTIEGSQLHCKLGGVLDTLAIQQLQSDVQPLLDNADKHIVIDCSTLEFISSSGLRLLLQIRKATIEKKGDVVIEGLSDVIYQVFVVTNFYKFFTFSNQ